MPKNAHVMDLIYRIVQFLDYGLFLPAIARLPMRAGFVLAAARGGVHFLLDLDWRSISLRRGFVRRRTLNAMKRLRPHGGEWTWWVKTLQRFVANSREEYEASLLGRRDMTFLLDSARVEGIEPLLEAQRSGVGVVLLTPHFDSYITGIALMGMLGLRINAMTTKVTAHASVFPSIQRYWVEKFRGMARYMNGGEILFYENNMRFFYKALKRGEALVIGGDLPPPSPRSWLDVNFLGKRRKMANGPLRIAQKTGSLICPFACEYKRPGVYHLVCSPPVDSRDGLAAGTVDGMYEVFNNLIEKKPERWWASDLMTTYSDAPRIERSA